MQFQLELFFRKHKSHGTAVAEIVYDMAPGATLYLIKVRMMDGPRGCKIFRHKQWNQDYQSFSGGAEYELL